MASADGIREDSFLSHVERVRSELQAMFQRAHKILQDRESDLLAELQKLVDEYTGEGIVQQINELSVSKEGLKSSLKGNDNKLILDRSVAPIDERIAELNVKLQTVKAIYRSVSLEWDVELDKRLSVAGEIRLNAVKEGMGHFLKNFKSIRNIQTTVPSKDQYFPPELHQQAKELIRTQSHQYSVLRIHDIIVNNLRAGRKINGIMNGLYSISKYPLCLFRDPERPEFHQIRTFSGYYTYEIKEQIEGFEPILEAMGYRYDKQSQLYKLDNHIRLSAGFDDMMALVGCELLLAYEELNFVQNNAYDPIKYFNSF